MHNEGTPSVHVPFPSKELVSLGRAIRQEAKEGIELAATAIPIPPVDIYFYDDPERAVRGMGIGWRYQRPNEINFLLDPRFHAFDGTLKTIVSLLVARELYVASRWEEVGYGKNLLTDTTTEGLASHFLHELGSERQFPWDKSFPVLSQETWLRSVRSASERQPLYEQGMWFHGEHPDKVPRWTGYTVGYLLVKQYLEDHPEEKPSSLRAHQAGGL